MRSEQSLFNHLRNTTKKMGFEFCAYGGQMPTPISQPQVNLINNYPDSWQQRYAERAYIDTDPTVRHGRTSSLPLIWSARVFETTPELWDEARAHGLKTGWCKSVRNVDGTVGMLSMARDGEELTATELFAKNARLSWLADYAHVGMCRLLVPEQVPETQVTLTEREQEVLRWTAEGKTAYEIGQILAVSERTVNFHINNLVTKFGASNKTQAAVKAIVLGKLY